MSTTLTAVAEAARAYCEVVMQETATQQELERGGLWVSRMVEVRERRGLAYVELYWSLKAAGMEPVRPVLDVSARAYRIRQAVYIAEDEAARTLAMMRAVRRGAWPKAVPARRWEMDA